MEKLKNCVKEKLIEKYVGVDKIPSQGKLSELVGLSQTTISRWLSDKIDRFDADALWKWSEFLECVAGDLIYFESQRNRKRS